MKLNYLGKAFAVLLLILPIFSNAQNTASVNNSRTATVQSSSQKSSYIEERNVRANMEFLAGDALQGRGSGTLFEHIAAQYFASLMRQFGIEPAGENDSSGGRTYIQTVNITRNTFAENPKLSYEGTSLEYGKDMLVYQISSEKVSGGLQKIKSGVTPKSGAILFLRADDEKAMPNLEQLAENAAAIIIEENPQRRALLGQTCRPKSFFYIFW